MVALQMPWEGVETPELGVAPVKYNPVGSYRLDPTRLVHYEGDRDIPEVDVWSRMYRRVNNLEVMDKYKNPPESDHVIWRLNYKQMGLGGDNSWGAMPLDKYQIPANQRL